MAGLIQRGTGVGIPKENQVMIPSSVDIFDEQGNNIGFINNFAPTHSRPADRVRVLDSFAAGRAVEMPPRPEDVTITIGGFGLYAKSLTDRGSLLNRIPGPDAAAYKSLNENKIPFLIVETGTHPAGTSPENINRTSYLGCLLTNFSKTINVGNATVTQNATVQVQIVD